jgi:hypothetical protein
MSAIKTPQQHKIAMSCYVQCTLLLGVNDRLKDLGKYPNTLLDEVEGGGDMALLEVQGCKDPVCTPGVGWGQDAATESVSVSHEFARDVDGMDFKVIFSLEKPDFPSHG